jgi:hypothetical protein
MMSTLKEILEKTTSDDSENIKNTIFFQELAIEMFRQKRKEIEKNLT